MPKNNTISRISLVTSCFNAPLVVVERPITGSRYYHPSERTAHLLTHALNVHRHLTNFGQAHLFANGWSWRAD